MGARLQRLRPCSHRLRPRLEGRTEDNGPMLESLSETDDARRCTALIPGANPPGRALHTNEGRPATTLVLDGAVSDQSQFGPDTRPTSHVVLDTLSVRSELIGNVGNRKYHFRVELPEFI